MLSINDPTKVFEIEYFKPYTEPYNQDKVMSKEEILFRLNSLNIANKEDQKLIAYCHSQLLGSTEDFIKNYDNALYYLKDAIEKDNGLLSVIDKVSNIIKEFDIKVKNEDYKLEIEEKRKKELFEKVQLYFQYSPIDDLFLRKFYIELGGNETKNSFFDMYYFVLTCIKDKKISDTCFNFIESSVDKKLQLIKEKDQKIKKENQISSLLSRLEVLKSNSSIDKIVVRDIYEYISKDFSRKNRFKHMLYYIKNYLVTKRPEQYQLVNIERILNETYFDQKESLIFNHLITLKEKIINMFKKSKPIYDEYI